MIISHKYKLIFVTTPKCGSHTGFKLMEDYFDAKGSFNHNRIIPHNYRHYRIFTFVRNPYERFCSLHNACVINPGHKKDYIPEYARRTRLAYAKWLALLTIYPREDLCAPQWLWHKGIMINDYVQIENAEKIFRELYPELNIQMPHELNRGQLTWEEVKTHSLTQYVNEWAGIDFNTYGYKKE